MSLVRPKLVQWSYSQRILMTKKSKNIKIRPFWGFPILGPILGPIFPLWAALFSLWGLKLPENRWQELEVRVLRKQRTDKEAADCRRGNTTGSPQRGNRAQNRALYRALYSHWGLIPFS